MNSLSRHRPGRPGRPRRSLAASGVPLGAGLLALAMLPAGCAGRREAPGPLRTIEISPGSMNAREPAPPCFVIWLPGRMGGPELFADNDFDRIARDAGAGCGQIAVEAPLGEYRRGDLTARLHGDVVAPILARGQRNVWIAGISLGGLGALLYAREHAHELEGIIVLSPYLGGEKMIEEIESAGGPRDWKPPASIGPRDFERMLWDWLQAYGGAKPGADPPPGAAPDPGDATKGPRPTLVLGYSSEEDFARSNDLLATLLPPADVITTSGGHDWKTWRALWGEIAKGYLTRSM